MKNTLPGFSAEYGFYRPTVLYRTLDSSAGHIQDLGQTPEPSRVVPAWGCVEFDGHVYCQTPFPICPPGSMDLAGVCVPVSCPAGQTNCNPFGIPAVCKNLQTDTYNCGSCAYACPEGQTCCNGNCCPQTWACCKDGCKYVDGDSGNCGGCGIVCKSDRLCKNGSCVCAPGMLDCNGTCCPGDYQCVNGLCQQCPSGQSPSNGCCIYGFAPSLNGVGFDGGAGNYQFFSPAPGGCQGIGNLNVTLTAQGPCPQR